MPLSPTSAGVSMSNNRSYQITDEGDEYQLSLFQDGLQVGGGLFPLAIGEDAAFDLAKSLGESFVSD